MSFVTSPLLDKTTKSSPQKESCSPPDQSSQSKKEPTTETLACFWFALEKKKNKGKGKYSENFIQLLKGSLAEWFGDKGQAFYFLQHALQHLSIIFFEMSQTHSTPIFTGKNIPLPCFPGIFHPGTAVRHF